MLHCAPLHFVLLRSVQHEICSVLDVSARRRAERLYLTPSIEFTVDAVCQQGRLGISLEVAYNAPMMERRTPIG
jgi:hypothetical protein